MPITGVIITAPTVAAGRSGAPSVPGDVGLVGGPVTRIAQEPVAHKAGLGNDANQTIFVQHRQRG